MPPSKTPTVFLVGVRPSKLTQYQLAAFERLYGAVKPVFEYLELTDWQEHLKFCKKNLDKKVDIVFIDSVGAREAQAGAAYWAIAHGYVHAIFGRNLEIRQLTGMTLKSKRLPKFR